MDKSSIRINTESSFLDISKCIPLKEEETLQWKIYKSLSGLSLASDFQFFSTTEPLNSPQNWFSQLKLFGQSRRQQLYNSVCPPQCSALSKNSPRGLSQGFIHG